MHIQIWRKRCRPRKLIWISSIHPNGASIMPSSKARPTIGIATSSTEDFRWKQHVDGTPVDHARHRVAMLVGSRESHGPLAEERACAPFRRRRPRLNDWVLAR